MGFFLRNQRLCLLRPAVRGSFLPSFSEWGNVLTASEKAGLEAPQSCRSCTCWSCNRNRCSCLGTSARVCPQRQRCKNSFLL